MSRPIVARIPVALRHAGGADEPVLESGTLRIDLARRVVSIEGSEVHLTPVEDRLLALLGRNAGKVWGPGHAQESHSIRVYVAQLRRKIEPEPARPGPILTEPGVGHRLRDAG